MITFLFWILALGLSVLILVGIVYLVLVNFTGAPYVPTSYDLAEWIFKELNPVAGKTLLDVGSGDGRIARWAAKSYSLKVIGIELHPFLIWYSGLLTWWKKIKGVTFIRKNFWQGKLPDADYIFFYLYPGTVNRLGDKIFRECQKGTLVVSKAFEITNHREKLIKTIEDNGHKAFFYRV